MSAPAEDRVDTLVIGAGVSGMTYAHARLRSDPNARVLVLEASQRPGGLMRTERAGPGNAYRFECGPEAITASNDAVRELLAELELPLEKLPESTKHRWVVHRGELVPVPLSPPAFLKSPLLSPLGKLRAATEPLRGKRHLDGSVADFVGHRLGREVLERLVDPMVAGIFAGDPAALSVRAAFPRMVQLVERHGSLLKGLRANRGGPPPTLVRPKGGVETLARGLAEALGSKLRVGCPVEALAAAVDGWEARAGERTYRANRIVLALSRPAAARLLAAGDEAQRTCATLLEQQPAESLACVVHAWDRARVRHPLDGFGYLVPSNEAQGSPALGTLFSSSISPTGTPDGQVLLRTMLGGARAPDICRLEDGELSRAAVAATRIHLSLEGEPLWSDVRRWEHALPSYDLSHSERQTELRAKLPARLELLGNFIDGIGVSALIERARSSANQASAGERP